MRATSLFPGYPTLLLRSLALITALRHEWLLAQDSGEEAAAAAGCAACGGFFIFFWVAVIALNIALLVWVARDAKSRGMDNAVVWMILVMCTSVLGLVIYLFSRPQGTLGKCSSCGNNRLQASAKCPHCGNA